jgi:hypothetical protein
VHKLLVDKSETSLSTRGIAPLFLSSPTRAAFFKRWKMIAYSKVDINVKFPVQYLGNSTATFAELVEDNARDLEQQPTI